jgi:hypothetical protein
MAGRAERGAQDGADTTRADDTHPQASIHLNLFRSRPADHPVLVFEGGPVWVPDYFVVFNNHGTAKFPGRTPVGT